MVPPKHIIKMTTKYIMLSRILAFTFMLPVVGLEAKAGSPNNVDPTQLASRSAMAALNSDSPTQVRDVMGTPPQDQSLQVSASNVIAGRPLTFWARATDADGDLASFSFYVTGPGYAGWNYIGGVVVAGSDATASFSWAPPWEGDWAVTFQAWDANGNANGDSSATFHVTSGGHAPQDQWVTVDLASAPLGQAINLTGRATDIDGDLTSFSFYVSGPGLPGWNYIGSKDASGSDDTQSFSWTPPWEGDWLVTCQAWDSEGNANGDAFTTLHVGN